MSCWKSALTRNPRSATLMAGCRSAARLLRPYRLTALAQVATIEGTPVASGWSDA